MFSTPQAYIKYGDLGREEASIGKPDSSKTRLEALGAWFAVEYEPLLRFAYFLSADPRNAEDLVQDAFLRIYRAGGRVEEPGFRAYARKTILNLARSSFRRAKTARLAEGTRWKGSGVDLAERVANYDLRQALLSLPVRQRACLALRFYEDRKDQEIADVLGISVGAVRKLIERAMKRLRVVLKEAAVP